MITYAGRVVYDRKKHFFKRKDVKRILTAMSDDPVERSDFLTWAYNVLLMAYGPIPTEAARVMEVATKSITDFVLHGPKGAPVARGMPITTEEFKEVMVIAEDPMAGVLADMVNVLLDAILYIEAHMKKEGDDAT